MERNLEFEACIYNNNTPKQDRHDDKAYQAFLQWKAVQRDLTPKRAAQGLSEIKKDACASEGAPKFCAVVGRMLTAVRREQGMEENHAVMVASLKP